MPTDNDQNPKNTSTSQTTTATSQTTTSTSQTPTTSQLAPTAPRADQGVVGPGTDGTTNPTAPTTVVSLGSVPVASSRIRDTEKARYRVTHESVAEAQAKRQAAVHAQNVAEQQRRKEEYNTWLAQKKDAKAKRDAAKADKAAKDAHWGEFNNSGIIASESWDAAGKATGADGQPASFDKLKYANAMSNINSYFGKNKEQAEKFRGLLSGATGLFKEDGSIDWSKVTTEDQYRMILGKAKNVRDGARNARVAQQQEALKDAEDRQGLLNTLREHGIDNKFDQTGKSVYKTEQLRQMVQKVKLADVTKALIKLRDYDDQSGPVDVATRDKLVQDAWQKGTSAGLKTHDMFKDDGSTWIKSDVGDKIRNLAGIGRNKKAPEPVTSSKPRTPTPARPGSEPEVSEPEVPAAALGSQGFHGLSDTPEERGPAANSRPAGSRRIALPAGQASTPSIPAAASKPRVTASLAKPVLPAPERPALPAPGSPADLPVPARSAKPSGSSGTATAVQKAAPRSGGPVTVRGTSTPAPIREPGPRANQPPLKRIGGPTGGAFVAADLADRAFDAANPVRGGVQLARDIAAPGGTEALKQVLTTKEGWKNIGTEFGSNLKGIAQRIAPALFGKAKAPTAPRIEKARPRAKQR